MAKETTTSAVSKASDKKNSPENKKIRAAQSVGNVKLNETKEYTILKDSKYYVKGDKVELNLPTAKIFEAKGLIKV